MAGDNAEVAGANHTVFNECNHIPDGLDCPDLPTLYILLSCFQRSSCGACFVCRHACQPFQ
jgi:hypothetical protein